MAGDCNCQLFCYQLGMCKRDLLAYTSRGFTPSSSTSMLTSSCVYLCIYLFKGHSKNNRIHSVMFGVITHWTKYWSCASMMPSSVKYFWLLVLLRGLVGIGEASYSTIAPTIIGDLFTGGERTIMIAAFYIFIPVGRSDILCPWCVIEFELACFFSYRQPLKMTCVCVSLAALAI